MTTNVTLKGEHLRCQFEMIDDRTTDKAITVTIWNYDDEASVDVSINNINSVEEIIALLDSLRDDLNSFKMNAMYGTASKMFAERTYEDGNKEPV